MVLRVPTTSATSSTSLRRLVQENRRCHLAQHASSADRLPCDRRENVSSTLQFVKLSLTSETYFHQQWPMVHATNCGVTQDCDAPDLSRLSWTKNVIDAAIVDCRVAACASEIVKGPQDVAVRFAVVFQIIGVKIGFVGSFQFKVEITCDEDGRRLRASLCPIHQRLCVGPPA